MAGLKGLALRPRLLPPALEWKYTRLFLMGGVGCFLGALVSILVALATGEATFNAIAWGSAAILFFALGYRGRAVHLENLALALVADRENARRQEVIGLATTGFAHELKNSLTVLKGFVELARRSDPELAQERLTAIDAQVTKLVGELKNFLVLARNEKHREERPLGDVLKEVVQLLGPLAQLREITFTTDIPEGLDRRVRDPDLRRALLNLGLNALELTKSRVTLSAKAEADTIVLAVEDDGPGIDPAIRSLLFTPYASGRANGTGLGLVQVREAAEKEGGHVEYLPAVPTGARFQLRLPATAATTPTPEPVVS